MRILVTGGAGFVGSHLCEALTKEHTVLCLDNFMSGSIGNIRHLLDLKSFKLLQGDVRDRDFVDRAMRDVQAVFHLAAQVHVDRSYIEPELTWDINVKGTQTILESARANDVGRVIFASSSEVYGTAQNGPIDEDHPLSAPHPYGASKIAADRMCHAYAVTYDMPVNIVRCFNIFGPRQREVGYGAVISIFTRRAFAFRPAMIYGDGSQSRDFIYVDDAVKGYLAILEKGAHDRHPVNFGRGEDITILDLARTISWAVRNGEIPPVHVHPRKGEVQRLIANPERARKFYDWQVSAPIEEDLKRFVEWYRVYGSL